MRGRLVALGIAVAVLMGGFVTVLVRSRTPDCGVIVQRPSLSAALRALGDFDQAYDAGQAPTLQDAAARVASAEYPALIGTTPEAPVVVAGTGTSPDALVVPLRAPAAASGSAPAAIVGLVVFARDCQGNAYFQVVENDVAAQPALTAFPPLTRGSAAAELGTTAVRLQYTASPLHPEWIATGSTAAAVPAR